MSSEDTQQAAKPDAAMSAEAVEAILQKAEKAADLTHAEPRTEPRIHVRWRADVEINGHVVLPALIRNISTAGAAVYFDSNIRNARKVKLRIHVPPESLHMDGRVMEIWGHAAYVAYDGEVESFRMGVHFQHFVASSDEAYLIRRLQFFTVK